MRYENWDILLFPQDNKTPLKEFRVFCQVVPDPEFTHAQGCHGLPTLCCFVPSLEAGTPFKISIHCWDQPSISQYTKSYTKFLENIIYEARLFIDGRLVASTSFSHLESSPFIIANVFDFSKDGDLRSLKFPPFQQELLQQDHWSPADELGRIKIVLSEGFPRDSTSMPIERVKNIVAFSFQHAPLGVLESSNIAWPNPSMWQRPSFASAKPVPTYPAENLDSHTHSPRRRASQYPNLSFCNLPHIQGVMENMPPGMGQINIDQKRSAEHSLADQEMLSSGIPGCFEWPVNDPSSAMSNLTSPSLQLKEQALRALQKTDTSMADYSSQMSQDHYRLSHRYSSIEEDSSAGHSQVPSNTPTSRDSRAFSGDDSMHPFLPQNSAMNLDLATTLTNSLLSQPAPPQMLKPNDVPANAVKSRKEARLRKPSGPFQSPQDTGDLRKVSQQMHFPSGASIPESTVTSNASKAYSSQARKPSETGHQRKLTNEFGANITNIVGSETTLSPGNLSEKGTKRIRNFTPASSKLVDEDDEPLRASPRVRLTPFAEDQN